MHLIFEFVLFNIRVISELRLNFSYEKNKENINKKYENKICGSES